MSERICDRARAGRLARVLVSDLVAEWGEEIRTGIEKDDLFKRMGPQLERARVFYRARVDPSVADRDRLFDFAVVDVMLAQNRAVRRYVW
jgi:hypothetical protein